MKEDGCALKMWLHISVSCARIEIDFGAVGSERLEFPEGTMMEIQHVIRSNSSTVYAYEVSCLE